MGGFAWVTLATNDSYSLGALVLAHSLRRVGTKYDLAVLVTPGVTGAMREKLSSVFSLVQEVNVLDSKDEANLALLARPELGITFTKLHCWRLTQYEKCVFVDADTLVIRNCDELFEREEFSASPDVGWPDCFNSGVFVFKPSQETFASITSFAAAKGSFDGGDQGLLNQYFSDWSHKDISKHLPFIYNMCSTATYSYLPAFKQFGEDVRIIHFIGITKPWLQYFDTLTGQVQPAPGSHHLQPLLQLWWNIFCENVHQKLSPEMASSTLARHWHEYRPYPTLHNDSRTFPLDCSVTNDSLYKNNEPDFSEFKDPWENHTERSIPVYNHLLNIINDNYRHDYHNYNNDEEYTDKNHSETSNAFEFSNAESFSLQSHSSDRNFCGDNETPTVLKNNETHEKRNDNCEFSTPVIHHLHVNPEDIDSRVHDDIPDCRMVNTRTSNRESCSVCEIENNENNKSIELVENYEHGNDVFDIEYRQNPMTPHQDKDPHHYCSGNNSKRQSDNDVNFRDQVSIECDLRRDFEENRLKDRSIIDISKEQTDLSDITLLSHSLPRTKSKNVTAQSETNITRQRESNDAGIAGALAKITLGEGRSPEQVALEEHMRKQSWEQGQIDYMGRDSFDNIWKKITETLGVQPKRQPSPPKTQPEPEKGKIEEPTALPTADQPTAKSEAAVPSEPQRNDEQDAIGELSREIRKLVDPLSELMPGESSDSTVSSRPSLSDAAIEEKIPVFTTLGSFDKSSSNIEKIESISESKSIVEDDSKTAPSCEIREEKQETFVAAGNVSDSRENLEIVAESQVPIQVAESVLEADVKESVTEDLKPVTEEAISSISLMAQESVPAVLETAMEASDPIAPMSNGTAVLRSEIGNGIDVLSPSAEMASATIAVIEESLDIVPPVHPRISQLPALTEDSAIQEDVVSPILAASAIEEGKITTERETLPVRMPEKVDSVIPAEIQSSSIALERAETPASPAEEPRALPSTIESTETPGGAEESNVSSADSHLSAQKKFEQSPVEKPKNPLGQFDSHVTSPTLPAEVSRAPEVPKTAPSSANLRKESDVTGILPKTERSSEKSNIPTSALVEKVVASDPPAAETKVPISCTAKSAKKIDVLTAKVEKAAIPESSSSTDEAIVDATAGKIEKTSQPESREKSPVRPVRTKEIEIPSTPTVTEATPPTSPPIDGAQSLQEPATKVTKKVVKKVTKKTSETKPADGNDPDTDGKKITKKIVKKVVKKKEDDGNGGESTSGNDKPKKIVKVVKKTTKAPQTLDAETTVPETPPPGTSEVPVPPKRKLKTTTKSTSGKSDSEP